MPTISSALATFVQPADGMSVEALSRSGFRVRFDTLGPDQGGAGASPTETVLAALAACTAMDVASIMRKKRQRIERYQIMVTAEKADEHPQVFTSIVVEHRITGHVSAEAVRRSVELSATAYCPVSAMLSRAVPIEHRYRLQLPELQEAEPAGESELVLVTGPTQP
jgi:putative redox protein